MAGYVQDCILLFGDSLTQRGMEAGGFSQVLSDVYQRKLDVVNRGYSGYNSKWAIPVLEKVLAKKSESTHRQKVKLLTIWWGANDASEESWVQHIPLAQYAKNLRTLIDMVKSPSSEWYSPHTRILLLTPPPVNTHQWVPAMVEFTGLPAEACLQNRTPARVKTYADAAVLVGKEAGVPTVNLFDVLWNAAGGVEKDLDKYMSDGLHLSTEGYKLVYAALMDSITANYPELHYDKLEMGYPDWATLNDSNYRALITKSRGANM